MSKMRPIKLCSLCVRWRDKSEIKKKLEAYGWDDPHLLELIAGPGRGTWGFGLSFNNTKDAKAACERLKPRLAGKWAHYGGTDWDVMFWTTDRHAAFEILDRCGLEAFPEPPVAGKCQGRPEWC